MKKNRNRQSGVAAIEFAFVIVPLLLLVFGVTEYGRAIYQYNTLVKSVRDATRLLSTQGPGLGFAAATCRAVYGNDNCSGSPLLPGLNASNVAICDATVCSGTHANIQTGSGVVNLVTVEISNYQFTSAVNFNIWGLQVGAPNITFSTISSTMRQAL